MPGTMLLPRGSGRGGPGTQGMVGLIQRRYLVRARTQRGRGEARKSRRPTPRGGGAARGCGFARGA
jgi:hypothetical protein